jgi:hypothetical protein
MAGELFESPSQVYQRLEKEKEAGRIAETTATAGVDPIRLGFQRQRAGREDIAQGLQSLFGVKPPEVQQAEQQQKITEAIKHIPFGTAEYYQAGADEAYKQGNLQVAQKFIALRDQAASTQATLESTKTKTKKAAAEASKIFTEEEHEKIKILETQQKAIGLATDNITKGEFNALEIDETREKIRASKEDLTRKQKELEEKIRNNVNKEENQIKLTQIKGKQYELNETIQDWDKKIEQARLDFDYEKEADDIEREGRELARLMKKDYNEADMAERQFQLEQKKVGLEEKRDAFAKIEHDEKMLFAEEELGLKLQHKDLDRQAQLAISHVSNQTKKEIAAADFSAPKDISAGDFNAAFTLLEGMITSEHWGKVEESTFFSFAGLEQDQKDHIITSAAMMAEKLKVSSDETFRNMDQRERLLHSLDIILNDKEILSDIGVKRKGKKSSTTKFTR